MPRNGKKVRRLLQETALQLYAHQGYDATTTAQIAEQAGVTERTFFRHFADKREVLFEGEAGLIQLLVDAINTAPPGQAPMTVLSHALFSVVPLVEANRSYTAPRRVLIESIPALRERALTKAASVSAAMAGALSARGVDQPLAALAVESAMAAFNYASKMWIVDPTAGLANSLNNAFASLSALTHPTPDAN